MFTWFSYRVLPCSFTMGRGRKGSLFPALTFASPLSDKGHRHSLWDFHASSGCSLSGVYEFDKAIETKYPRPRDSDDTNLVSHPWEGWEFKVKVLADLVLPKHRCGKIHSRPACLLGLKMDGFSLHPPCSRHHWSMSQFPLLVILNEGLL